MSLTIEDGEIFGLVGQSGAGKSTLLRTINQLEKIDSGSILVNGVDVSTLNGKALREFRKGIAMIFQHFSIMETQTVFQNIALPLVCEHWKKKDIEKRVHELAEIVGLTEKLQSKPRELSGGQKQRVAIARSLALDPKILLCDEATSALDPITTDSILDLLKKINKEMGITIIIVTHQMEVIKSACKRIAILKDGNLLEVGETDDLFLSSSSALKTLVVEDEIVPTTGRNIKLYFPKTCTAESIITKMARELNCDFSIVWGKLEKFQELVLGTLIINVSDENFDRVIEYLGKTDVRVEIIKGGDR
ncbi:MAG: methionine ABC transporter ATP-binding protein [Bacilli bacterium]|nr:methionine ABC transporter ATP-binding protein [Bacilli bacterium]